MSELDYLMMHYQPKADAYCADVPVTTEAGERIIVALTFTRPEIELARREAGAFRRLVDEKVAPHTLDWSSHDQNFEAWTLRRRAE